MGEGTRTARRAVAGRRAAGAAVAAALLLGTAGCAGNNDPAEADPEMTPLATESDLAAPSPSPSPTPPPVIPVRGERHPESVDVGDGSVLGADDRSEVDEAAIVAFADAIFAWLDAHLTDVQSGGAGHLAEVLPDGLAPEDPTVVPALTSALASPGQPVAGARYDLTAYHDSGPQFATVVVTLDDPTGTTRTATLVFAPASDGSPELVLAESEVAP